MKKSLCAVIMIVGLGLFLLPATMYAQSDQYSPTNSPIEKPHASENVTPVKNVFYVKIKDALDSLFGKIKSMITGKGGSMQGNEEGGSFEGESALGTIKGQYRRVSDTEVEITISCKPILIPYRAIEAKIRECLS
jgi:hypothetical protein